MCFSVPSDLKDCAMQLAKVSNWIYMKRFLLKLEAKLKVKNQMFPNEIDIGGFAKVKTFADFDGRYIAPFHGFSSADDYWAKSSSKQFIPEIKIPTLLVTALDDPFLSKKSVPIKEAEDSTNFYLETPKHGGHVGFIAKSGYWSERRGLEFFSRFD